MKRRVLSSILTLTIILSMFPTVVLAAEGNAQAEVEFDGNVMSCSTIETAWSYAQTLASSESKPVTIRLLSDVEVEESLVVVQGSYIVFDGGEYTLSGPSGGKAIQIESTGLLMFHRGTISVSGNECVGIYNDGGTFTMKGGNITAEISGGNDEMMWWGSTGYCVYNNGGTVAIEGSDISNALISSGEYLESGTGYGIYNNNGSIAVNGSNIETSGGQSYGIYSDGDNSVLTVSYGNIEMISGSQSYGIYVKSGKSVIESVNINAAGSYNYGITVSDGTTEIRGGNITCSGYDSAGAVAFGGSITVSGVSVKVTGGGFQSYGAWASGGNITISGGDISNDENYGVYVQGDSDGSNVSIAGGTVTGGKYGVFIYSGAERWPGSINITNGRIVGGEYGVYVSNNGAPTVNVSGGNITGGNVGIYYGKIYNNSRITGGIFSDGTSAVQVNNGATINDVLGDELSLWQNDKELVDTDVYGSASVPGPVTVLRGGSVATVTIDGNAAGYTAITDALDAAKGKTATVTLLTDVETGISLQVTNGSNITFEGGGYSLSGSVSEGIFRVGGGMLTVNSGNFSNSGNEGVSIYVDGGTLNFAGGEITTNDVDGGGSGIYVHGGTANISGGKITANGSGSAISIDGGTVNIFDGKIIANEEASTGLNVLEGTVCLSGGAFTGAETANRIESLAAVGELLADGYGYQKGGDEWLEGDALGATVITEDVIVSALPSFTVTVEADPAEGGTVTGKGTYHYKDNVTVTAEANSGYEFAKWTKNGEEVSIDTPYSFEITENIALTAVFEKSPSIPGGDSTGSSSDKPTTPGTSSSSSVTTYPPTVFQPNNGSVSASPSNPKRGDTVTVSPVPDDGYEVGDIVVKDRNGNELEIKDNGDGTFSFTQPTGKVTIAVTFVPQEDKTDSPALAFSDIDSDAWYFEAVDYVIRKSLMTGYGKGKFAPGDELSRAMLAQILYNVENRPGVAGDGSFTDVLSGAWYVDAVTWAADNGIVAGYGNGTYGPDDPITREQLAVMLYRYAQSKDGGLTDAQVPELDFADTAEISDWAYDAMSWCAANGIMEGKGDGILDPKGQATRAETAAMLMRFLSRQ